MNVSEWLGLPIREGQFGIEVEVEGAGLPLLDNRYWTSTNDPSLRGNGLEYVLKKPLNFKFAEAALNYLEKKLANSEVDFSFRTSVHVHLNVLSFTPVQLANLVYLGFLMEEPLTRFCGASRVGNRFCLRSRDAEAGLEYLTHHFSAGIRRGTGFPVLEENEIRYMFLNLGALQKFGSIEFRSMRGTSDAKLLTKWLRILDCIYQFALKSESPRHLAEIGPLELFHQIFGDLAEDLNYVGMSDDLRRSFSRLIDFPYSCDWVVAGKAKEKNVKAFAFPDHFVNPA